MFKRPTDYVQKLQAFTRCKGVFPPTAASFGTSTSALASIRYLTQSKWPLELAM